MLSGSIQDHDFTLLTEPELLASPMEDIHKDLALLHFRRLHRVLHAPNPASLPVNTSRAAAYEQLVRMTNVMRAYLARATAEGEMGEDVGESMIADIVDACLSLDCKGDGRREVGCASGTLDPPPARERGRERLTQESHTHIATLSPTSVHQLRSPPEAAQVAKASCLPAETIRDDLGSELDWASLLHRSRSEDDLLHRDRQTRNFQVLEARDRIRGRLLRPRVEEGNGISWPPAPSVETLLAAMPPPSSSSPPVSSPPPMELRHDEDRKGKTRATDPSALPPPLPAAAPSTSSVPYSSAPPNTAAATRRSRKRTDVSETLSTWKDYLVRNQRHLSDWFRNSVAEGRKRGVDVFVD
ncbi:hypothetical protein D0862_12556 [Hortaea werneckii]|uniref:Uncharacterized protein n=1 Tax=Hortaea werneckii TaxID=91943 RepID=A0A3M7EXA0_HORWE|nr:hypothetical protein D0862_12556 [Hortaea werneckii]